MTHFASYWQFYNKRQEPLVLTGWRIRSKNRLADAVKGDVLWLFTSGDKCLKKLAEEDLPDGGIEGSQAYLTAVFTVSGIIPEIASPFGLLVNGVRDKCIRVCPPILIDDIVRPRGWDKEKPIGSLRQGAWRLPPYNADLLQNTLRRESPNVYRRIFG